MLCCRLGSVVIGTYTTSLLVNGRHLLELPRYWRAGFLLFDQVVVVLQLFGLSVHGTSTESHTCAE